MKWYSEGWIAWVGTYDDLKNGREGQYRIKIAHTYLDNQNEPTVTAKRRHRLLRQCRFARRHGRHRLYGIFSTEKKASGTYKTDKGAQTRKTCIVSKRINLADVEKLLPAKAK